MVPSDDDDDDDGILTIGDEISSFNFLDDDDVMRHQKKWRRHDNLAFTVIVSIIHRYCRYYIGISNDT